MQASSAVAIAVVPQPLAAPPAITSPSATRITIPSNSHSSRFGSRSQSSLLVSVQGEHNGFGGVMKDTKREHELLVPVVTPTDDDSDDLAAFEDEIAALNDEESLLVGRDSDIVPSSTPRVMLVASSTNFRSEQSNDDSMPQSVSACLRTKNPNDGGKEKVRRLDCYDIVVLVVA